MNDNRTIASVAVFVLITVILRHESDVRALICNIEPAIAAGSRAEALGAVAAIFIDANVPNRGRRRDAAAVFAVAALLAASCSGRAYVRCRAVAVVAPTAGATFVVVLTRKGALKMNVLFLLQNSNMFWKLHNHKMC